MKLAVQTLSHSESTALTYYREELKDRNFSNIAETVKFCNVFNNAFD